MAAIRIALVTDFFLDQHWAAFGGQGFNHLDRAAVSIARFRHPGFGVQRAISSKTFMSHAIAQTEISRISCKACLWTYPARRRE